MNGVAGHPAAASHGTGDGDLTEITQDGLRFNIRLQGREGAPWVVFSIWLLTDLCRWDHVVAALSGRFRILRHDQRGYGGTAVPPGAGTILQLAEGEGRIAADRRDAMRALADATVARWLAAHAALPSPWCGHDLAHAAERFVACAHALQEFGLRPGLEAMRVPALFVAETENGATPALMPLFASAAPGARCREIAGA